MVTMSTTISSHDPAANWDFRDADTKEGSHVIHSYPAMMIPQVARGLITRLQNQHPTAQTLLDPFCGAGTVLVEAAQHGLTAWGNDLNPLALRIAKTRTTAIDNRVLTQELTRLSSAITPMTFARWDGAPPDFKGREFWFKHEVSRALAFVRHMILTQITDTDVLRLCEMAFSETVRLASNTRNGEFKLYRMDASKLASFEPDVLKIFDQTLTRYAQGLRAATPELLRAPTPVRITFGDTRTLDQIPDRFFDLMVTSPPYGDSRTTVAYGQFSRLSLEWLGLPPEDARQVDGQLLGGRSRSVPSPNPIASAAAQEGLRAIASQDASRAHDVEHFYRDLDQAIEAITQKLKPDALCAWVVANRTVKGVVLPTNIIISELSQPRGYEMVETITRNIPNKRMPLTNSPSNVPGVIGSTMRQEHLVILRYRGPMVHS